MSFEGKKLGQSGEDLAFNYLKKRGYEILGRNIRLFCGEIDILAKDRDAIVVVEVKTKTTSRFSLPQEQVHTHKKQKLIQLAQALTQKYPKRPIRIDVIAIDEEQNKLDHIVSAVEEE